MRTCMLACMLVCISAVQCNCVFSKKNSLKQIVCVSSHMFNRTNINATEIESLTNEIKLCRICLSNASMGDTIHLH